jgi:hypothetical protein
MKSLTDYNYVPIPDGQIFQSGTNALFCKELWDLVDDIIKSLENPNLI